MTCSILLQGHAAGQKNGPQLFFAGYLRINNSCLTFVLVALDPLSHGWLNESSRVNLAAGSKCIIPYISSLKFSDRVLLSSKHSQKVLMSSTKAL